MLIIWKYSVLTCLGNYYSHVFKDLAQSHFELTSSNYSAEMSINPVCPNPEQLLTHLLFSSLCLMLYKKIDTKTKREKK